MGWFTAIALVFAAVRSWQLHQEWKAEREAAPKPKAKPKPKPKPGAAAGPSRAQVEGTAEVAADGSLRRFVPPGFDSPRGLGGMVETVTTPEGETFQSPATAFAAEAVEIVGLVDDAADFVSAHGKAIVDGWCIHRFLLAAWGVRGQAVQSRELDIQRPLPDKRFRGDITLGTVVRMRVFLDDTGTKGVVDELIARDQPLGEFAAILEERRKPLRVATTEFGPVEYDRRRRWFVGRGQWRGQAVEVTFHATSAETLEPLLSTARALWGEQAQWESRVDTALCNELLESANDYAHDMDDPALSAEQFLARLRLESISFDGRGYFTFWFDDGDVFGGHVVEAWGSLASGIEHCVYEG